MENQVKTVYINADCYFVCMQHAFSTEREEILGLLMGELDEDATVQISALIMMRRSDKRKDRVEISPEQLMLAAESAENLTKELQHPMRVVGWYHSHPHITVLPSAVDCRTQYMYQMMDKAFIGLIFSVFPGDSTRPEDQSLQVICFQSIRDEPTYSRIEVELHVAPSGGYQQLFSKRMLELPAILYAEEKELYESFPQHSSNLSSVHNAAVFTSSLLHSMSVVEAPLLEGLSARAQMLSWRNKRCRKKKSLAYADLKNQQFGLANIRKKLQAEGGTDCCR